MTQLFSAWIELPMKMLTIQQAYFEAVSDTTVAGNKMIAALQANQSAAEAGMRALGRWTTLMDRAL